MHTQFLVKVPKKCLVPNANRLIISNLSLTEIPDEAILPRSTPGMTDEASTPASEAAGTYSLEPTTVKKTHATHSDHQQHPGNDRYYS